MVKNMINKKLTIFCLILATIILIPNITANTVSNITQENELVEITIDLCGLEEEKEKTVQLTQKESHNLETLFDDMKTKLESVDTNHETIEIFNEVIEELDELELLPKDMTVKEAQQLVTKINCNERILGDDNENFNCFISGKTLGSAFFKPGWPIFLTALIPIKFLINGIISFGWEKLDYENKRTINPASGWVWTKGSNSVKTWEGDTLWGNLGKYHEVFYYEPTTWDEYWFYKGATGFNGISIRGFSSYHFFGTASHVSIVNERP